MNSSTARQFARTLNRLGLGFKNCAGAFRVWLTYGPTFIVLLDENFLVLTHRLAPFDSATTQAENPLRLDARLQDTSTDQRVSIKNALQIVSIKSNLDDASCVGYKHCVAVLQGPFYRALGQRLRDARREARLSQIKLANTVGLSRSSIANIESGRQPIYIHALVSIAGQLGVSLKELIPPEYVADDQRIQHELSKLGLKQRNWVVQILKSPPNQEKENNGTEVLVIPKTRHAIAAASASKKTTGSNRKARDLVKGGNKVSAFRR